MNALRPGSQADPLEGLWQGYDGELLHVTRYLLALAVHPGHQGSGWGSQLVRHGLARAQSMRLPSYLETTNPRNLVFYQRHGFQLVGERVVAGGGPTVWGMLYPVAV